MNILSPTIISAALVLALMMFQSMNQLWQSIVLAAVGSLLTASGALWVQARQYKRQRQAELEKTGDQSYAELGHVVLELTDKERARLEEALQRVTVRLEEVHQKELQFLQEQLRHRGNLEVQARNRTHSALAEVQRCVMTIRAHEEVMRAHSCQPGENHEIEFTPFVFKTYEQIIGDADKIPTIREGME